MELLQILLKAGEAVGFVFLAFVAVMTMLSLLFGFVNTKDPFLPFLGWICALFGLTCYITVFPALFFVKWDDKPSHGSYGEDDPRVGAIDFVIRGDFPAWLSWLQTPDERLPGGLYEPTVLGVYTRRGRFACSYYWAGVRNQGMGFAAWLGKKADDYVPPQTQDGLWTRDSDNVWTYTKHLGKLMFVMGWQVYRLADKSFLAVPLFTLKVNRD